MSYVVINFDSVTFLFGNRAKHVTRSEKITEGRA